MNVVDSCGWLEYFADDDNADFFAPILEDTENLLVPAIVIYEVCRRTIVVRGESELQRSLSFLNRGRLVHIDTDALVQASIHAAKYKLAMADAIIWQTAQTHGATLYTQDATLKGLPNVKFKAKKS